VAGFERLGEPGPLSCGLASLSVGPARAPWVPQDNGLLIHASGALLFRHVCTSVSNDGRSQSNLVIILKKRGIGNNSAGNEENPYVSTSIARFLSCSFKFKKAKYPPFELIEILALS
jgi:hypothetical protein